MTTQIERGKRLDPEALQAELEKLRTLLMSAFHHNVAMQKRIRMQNLVMMYAADSLRAYHETTIGNITTEGPNHYISFHNMDDMVAIERTGTGKDTMTSTLGKLRLNIEKEYNKIPLIDNEYGERKPVSGISISVDGQEATDEDMAWALLSPDMFWTTVSEQPEIEMVVDLPSGLDPNVNHIGIETILPQLTQYKVEYMDHRGGYTVLRNTRTGTEYQGVSEHFYFPAALFGNRIKLTLRGYEITPSTYLYGLGHMYVGLQRYVPTGRIIAPIRFTQGSGDYTVIKSITPSPHTPNIPRQSDVVRYRIGTEYTETPEEPGQRAPFISGAILYDSDRDEYPIQTREIGPITQEEVYLEITFDQFQQTSPTSDGLVVNYEWRNNNAVI